jgi:hypothetical protein
MKKLLITLFVLAAMFIPKPVLSADDYDKEWLPGDSIVVGSVCKSEKVILEVARNDTISEEATLNKIREFTYTDDCLTVFPPIPFYVHSIIVSYKDFKKRPSVVLALRFIGDKDQMIVGYAIGAGSPGSI